MHAESPDFFLFLAFPQFSLQYGVVDAVRPAFNVNHKLVKEYLYRIRQQQQRLQKQFVPEDDEVVLTSSVRRPFISLDPPSIGVYQ